MERKNKIPTMAEMIAEFAPETDVEIGDVFYGDEDEEERLDTMSNLLPFEEKYYDKQGNWIEDPEDADY